MRGHRVLVALGLVAVMSACSNDPGAGDPVSPTPRLGGYEPPGGQEYLVDGINVWMRCEGTGSPTVVLEAGSDSQGSSDFPSELTDDLSATNRTCVHDRPGTGLSDDPLEDRRTVDDLNRALHELLAAAEIPGPYVLVGNSGGGILSIEFASRYRDEVSGLVLLDVPAPQGDLDPKLEGVSPNTNDERMDWVELEHRLAVDPPNLGDLPIVIVTATDGQSNVKDQAYWLDLSDDASQLKLEGEHAIQMSDPEGVVESIRAVTDPAT